MRLPSGYGTVYKLSGNRRNPWIARKTIGWDDNGKQLYYTIGYFKTRPDAIAALSEYNKKPIGKRGDISLGALYDEWSKSKYEKISNQTKASYRMAFNHLFSLKDEKMKDIKKSHIQKVIDNMEENGMSISSCHKVKILAGILYDYAMADDIVDKNYARLVEMPVNKDEKEKEIFTDLEIKRFEREAISNHWASVVVILIYTGMRISELLSLPKANIDIINKLITGGIKTDAGKNRIIPIHKTIEPYIKYWLEQDGVYLITRNGKKIRYEYFREFLYYPLLETLNIRKLTIHTTRHTFASLINKAGADKVSIQKLIGHADYSTTANIYTHPEILELRRAIDMI